MYASGVFITLDAAVKREKILKSRIISHTNKIIAVTDAKSMRILVLERIF